ncbi:glycosyltransferase family 2 protein [Chitinophaga pinensis]|uniref:Glycosyltransferase family 2 protein n=1 Tax=Chitinophaga pinensis TaxID=79329 RepID=A0A5C6LY27_9BACT|nr:glycosyltransferase family 2 protein [Chitinophaga pinensis]TWW01712.1 glycosyltransferase family 2 protein [Chitinophaga pinensis]
MKVSGFTFVRNAVKYDYPVVASIKSILPLCDEVIVSVGNCEDGTLELIQSIGSPKIKIFHSVWDDSLKEGGRVLAVETDKAYAHVSADSDWAFYIQADEVVHEQDYDAIRVAMQQYRDDKRVEGLLFRYTHFFGSYDYIGDSRTWYQNEIRIIRNDKRIASYRDAQGFRKEGQKLHVKPVNARMYHYGWVKDPKVQAKKVNNSFQMYHGSNETDVNGPVSADAFDYGDVDSLAVFKGTHPAVMQERIHQKNWQFSHDISRKKMSFKDTVLYWVEKITGKRLFDYRNYKVI